MNTLAFTLGEHRSQLTLKISTYPNGNLAIKLYEKDHGVLIFWETLTTNLTGIRPDHCAFINIKAADGLFPVWLSDNHLAEPTGQILESNGCLYPEYLFYGKELDALDHEGHTLYIRHQKGELGCHFERLYIALRRLAREINGFSYTDYSGWRCLDGSSSTLPLWIEASDPSHGRKFIFTQKGPALQTIIRYSNLFWHRPFCSGNKCNFAEWQPYPPSGSSPLEAAAPVPYPYPMGQFPAGAAVRVVHHAPPAETEELHLLLFYRCPNKSVRLSYLPH